MDILVPNKSFRIEKDLWAGERYCDRCKQSTNSHLVNLAYGAGFLRGINKCYISCDKCGDATEISYLEHKEIKNKQVNLLDEGKFPQEIIKKDFNEEALRISALKKEAILWLILPIFMLVGLVNTTIGILFEQGLNLGIIVLDIFVVSISCIPFLLSLKNFMKAKKWYIKYNGLYNTCRFE